MTAWLRAHRRWLRPAPVVVVAIALLALLLRNTDTPHLPHYEVPEGFVPAPPPTTAGPGAAPGPLVASVRGTTTTTVAANVGRARIAGFVSGPQGPVAGAIVRLERVVTGTTQVVDVTTGADGRYDANGIGGGRYRVRAFLPPTLAQAAGEVLFLRADEERTLDLAVDAFTVPAITLAYSPEQALLGDPVNIAIGVSGRVVDADGVVVGEPAVGATVQLTVLGGGWTTPAPSVSTTDSTGQVEATSSCRTTASSQLQVAVRLAGAVPGTPPTTATFDIPACVDPATLTTTTTDASSTTSTTA